MTDLTKQLCRDAIDNPSTERSYITPPYETYEICSDEMEAYNDEVINNPQLVLELLERIEVLEKLLRMINSYAVIHIVGKHPEVSIPASYLEDIEEALNGGRG